MWPTLFAVLFSQLLDCAFANLLICMYKIVHYSMASDYDVDPTS